MASPTDNNMKLYLKLTFLQNTLPKVPACAGNMMHLCKCPPVSKKNKHLRNDTSYTTRVVIGCWTQFYLYVCESSQAGISQKLHKTTNRVLIHRKDT